MGNAPDGVLFTDGFDEGDTVAFGLGPAQLCVVVAGGSVAMLIFRSPLAPFIAVPLAGLVLAISAALKFAIELNPEKPEPLHLFFDRGEHSFGALKDEWLRKRTTPGRTPSAITMWDMIANIEEVDQALAAPVQAADIIAWSRTRGLSQECRDWRYLADVISTTVL